MLEIRLKVHLSYKQNCADERLSALVSMGIVRENRFAWIDDPQRAREWVSTPLNEDVFVGVEA